MVVQVLKVLLGLFCITTFLDITLACGMMTAYSHFWWAWEQPCFEIMMMGLSSGAELPILRVGTCQ